MTSHRPTSVRGMTRARRGREGGSPGASWVAGLVLLWAGVGPAGVAFAADPAPGFPPVSLQDRISATVTHGVDYRLRTVVIGSLPMTYTWYRNYEEIPGAEGPELALTSITPDDAGAYWARVANAFGEILTKPIFLNVLGRSDGDGSASPVRVRPWGGGFPQVSGATLLTDEPGATIRFTLDGTEPGPASAAYYDGMNLSLGIDCTLRAAAFVDGVRIGGIAEARFQFFFPDNLGIARQPEDQRVAPGVDVVWDVEAEGREPLEYTWYFTGGGIFTVVGRERVLSLANVTRQQSGFYRVLVRNHTGVRSSRDALLMVVPIDPPRIAFRSPNVTVYEGNDVVFTVVAEGQEPLRYTWKYGDDTIVGAEEATLRLTGVTVDQSGTYRVTVSNAGGSVDSAPFTLTVRRLPRPLPPEIFQQPVSQTVDLAARARFYVGVTGTYPMTFWWNHNGARIPGAASHWIEFTAQMDSAGTYSMVASNAVGVLESDVVTLSVIEPPPVVVPPGGAVWFINRVAGVLDAPVFDADGRTPLEGPGFVAQLRAGARPEALEAMGPPVRFRAGAGAGYFPGSLVYVPDVAPGETAWVQVCAWEAAGGTNYEAAVSAGARHGVSSVVPVTTGNAGTPPTLPAVLVGLRSFRLQDPAVPLPRILAVTGRRSVLAGENVTLGVVIDGPPPWEIAWFAGEPGGELTLLAEGTEQVTLAALKETTTVWVRVGNAGGILQSEAIVVEVVVDPYRHWAATRGLGEENGDPRGDPDGDGVPNLMEYLLGGMPLVPDEALPPAWWTAPTEGGHRIGFEVAWSHAATGVDLVLQVSDELATWETVASDIATVRQGETSDVVRITTVAPAGGAHRFYRWGVVPIRAETLP